jgi:hypothetical protein
MLEAHLDESYNNRTFCVGGWLAPVSTLRSIEKSWKMRIDFERRMSIKKRFPPISRYHASDCANLKGEFDRSKGWDTDRQIRFSKKLLEIIGKNKPIGIVMGGSVDDYLHHFTGDAANKCRNGLYFFSICVVMDQIAQAMKMYYPDEKVAIYYDRGKFSGMADRAFRSMVDDPRNSDISKYFVTMAPMGWEDCTLLQPADLLAYEGLKRIDGSLNDNDAIRKSLQALIGSEVDLCIGHFTRKSFEKLIDDKVQELMSITGGAIKLDEDGYTN